MKLEGTFIWYIKLGIKKGKIWTLFSTHTRELTYITKWCQWKGNEGWSVPSTAQSQTRSSRTWAFGEWKRRNEVANPSSGVNVHLHPSVASIFHHSTFPLWKLFSLWISDYLYLSPTCKCAICPRGMENLALTYHKLSQGRLICPETQMAHILRHAPFWSDAHIHINTDIEGTGVAVAESHKQACRNAWTLWSAFPSLPSLFLQLTAIWLSG